MPNGKTKKRQARMCQPHGGGVGKLRSGITKNHSVKRKTKRVKPHNRP